MRWFPFLLVDGQKVAALTRKKLEIRRNIMQEERMQVLRMVDEGKINVEEATKLLEALKASGMAVHSPNFEEKFNNFAKETKDFFKEVGCKINKLCKDAEPKIKEAAKKVASKTAEVADNISQSLNEKIKNMEEEGCCEGERPCDAPVDNGQRPEGD
jgi:polyhydroxyalkanoate synthesis regulator phasin